MAIRYNQNFNNFIRQEVANYNRRRKTAIKRGLKDIPDKVYVSELKRRYDKRNDLERELKLLGEFKFSSLNTTETTGGAKTNAWQMQHIKTNLKQAKDYFDKQVEILSERSPRYPGERQRLDTALKNKSVLNYDMENLTQEQYDSLKGSINSFIRARNVMGSGYRGFLSEVDDVMSTVGVPDSTKNQFFRKINTLSQEQFFYMYERSDLIKRVYDLYVDKDEEGNVRLNASKTNAELLINTLLDEIDVLVDEAKNKA